MPFDGIVTGRTWYVFETDFEGNIIDESSEFPYEISYGGQSGVNGGSFVLEADNDTTDEDPATPLTVNFTNTEDSGFKISVSKIVSGENIEADDDAPYYFVLKTYDDDGDLTQVIGTGIFVVYPGKTVTLPIPNAVLDKDYYLFETDKDGNIYEHGVPVTVGDEYTFIPEYSNYNDNSEDTISYTPINFPSKDDDGNTITYTADTSVKQVSVLNREQKTDAKGSISVSKNVLVDG